ncbi:histone H1 [bacterium]|nr:histone H1 [bacterium]
MSNETFKTTVDTYLAEVEKFNGGNSAAGTRARKALQEIIKLSRDERKRIQEEKNSRKAAK